MQLEEEKPQTIEELLELWGDMEIASIEEMQIENLRDCCWWCALQADAMEYKLEIPELIDLGGES